MPLLRLFSLFLHGSAILKAVHTCAPKFSPSGALDPRGPPGARSSRGRCQAAGHLLCKKVNVRASFAEQTLAKLLTPDGHIVALRPGSCGPAPTLNFSTKDLVDKLRAPS